MYNRKDGIRISSALNFVRQLALDSLGRSYLVLLSLANYEIHVFNWVEYVFTPNIQMNVTIRKSHPLLVEDCLFSSYVATLNLPDLLRFRLPGDAHRERLSSYAFGICLP